MSRGRRREAAALAACVERLRRGAGGVVSVGGDAGMGKSHLIGEVRAQASGRAARWLEGRALSFSQSLSYWPFLEILRQCTGIAEDDDTLASWAKLERRVRTLFDEDTATYLPYLATLLALPVPWELADRVKYLDGRAMARQVLLTSRKFFERLARRRPVVLVFEDLDSVDAASAELVEHLFPLVETAPLLVCLVSRGQSGTRAARLRETAAGRYASRYSEISLSPLDPAACTALIRSRLGDDVPSSLRAFVLDRAKGNPGVIQDLLSAIRMLGAAGPTAGGAERAVSAVMATVGAASDTDSAAPGAESLEQFRVPDTLPELVTIRLDRLDDELARALKLDCQIEPGFLSRVLEALSAADRVLDSRTGARGRDELTGERTRAPWSGGARAARTDDGVWERGAVAESDGDSILRERLRELHGRVGECIETLFADRLDELSALLAYHFTRAESWETAREYLLRAGDQAGKLAADTEALIHYREALAAWDRGIRRPWDPRERAILERKMGDAFFRRGDHRQASASLQRALGLLGRHLPVSRWGIRLGIAREIVRQIGYRLARRGASLEPTTRPDAAAQEIVTIYARMGWIDYFLGGERLVLDLLLWLNEAERSRDLLALSEACEAVGLVCDTIPAFRIGRRYHREGIAIAEALRHPLRLGFAYLGHGLHELGRGRWDAAIEHFERAAGRYREGGDLRGWAGATQMVAWVLRLQGKFAASLQRSETIVAIGDDAGDHQAVAWAVAGIGWTHWHTGDLAAAEAALLKAIALYEGIPDHQGVAEATSDLGLCYLRQGRRQDAITALETSNRVIAERGLRGVHGTRPRNGLADLYLAVVEQANGATRTHALRKARRACKAALKHTRIDRSGLPGACRVRGTYEWLKGRSGAARRWWLRSLSIAKELGAPFEVGTTHLEIGRRLRDRIHLRHAEAIFTELGATLDLAMTRRYLLEVQGP
jgi:tetratricopeptide (TPR) repeat protein